MRILSLPCALIATFVLSCNVWAADFEYVNYSVADSYMSGKEQFTIDDKGGKMLGVDTIDDLQICHDDSIFECFHNPAINFSVPRAKFNVGQAWTNAGSGFDVERHENLEILGVELPVFVIRSGRPESKEYYFYYSEMYGLVAIKLVDARSNEVRFFVSKMACGFGAKVACGKNSENEEKVPVTISPRP